MVGRVSALGFVACSLLVTCLVADDTQKVVLVGDSTVASGSGWGDSFGARLRANVRFVNWARSGRSSKSFRDEGWWQKALDEQPTWIFIQFGHNDQPGKGPQRETDPQTSYRENLTRYVKEARAAGAAPVLVTSLTRRVFGRDGQIDLNQPEPISIPAGFRLIDYARATIAVAEELNVPLIDLNALSVQQMNQLGPERAASFNPQSADRKSPDRTHLTPQGADATALLVAKEVRRVIPAFVPLFKD